MLGTVELLSFLSEAAAKLGNIPPNPKPRHPQVPRSAPQGELVGALDLWAVHGSGVPGTVGEIEHIDLEHLSKPVGAIGLPKSRSPKRLKCEAKIGSELNRAETLNPKP